MIEVPGSVHASPLTGAQAAPVVASALHRQQGQAAPATAAHKASAVRQAASTATGLSASIELSSPVILKPWARIVFAVLLLFAALGVHLWALEIRRHVERVKRWTIGLAVVGALVLIVDPRPGHGIDTAP